MSVIDFILNIAGLLLWLSWRSLRFDPLARTTPATLVGTLKPAHPKRWRGWQFIGGLFLLLVFRAVLYWQVGPPSDWTPRLNFGVVILAFRSNRFPPALLFSVLSFCRIFFVFYSWLLALNVINRGLADKDPILRLIELHLGRIGRWPRFVVVLLPLAVIIGAWAALHPLMVRMDVLTPTRGFAQVLLQSVLLAIALLLTLKFILPLLLFLHLLGSYVYLGSSPMWDFVANTSHYLLKPLRWLPLRSAKLDFAPLAGIILLFLLLHALPQYLVTAAQRAELTIWPQ
jgi:uncharacterized protein YggT (Ycf19 family)